MKTKIAFWGLLGVACWLMISYFWLEYQDKGRQLVTDAYYANLLNVKNDVEEGAPLDYAFYFQDQARQYNGVLFNALHAAASGGNEDIINFLLEQGFNINTQTPDGWTPLFIAARDGNAEAAKLLVYRGADLNLQTDRGASALLMVLTQPFSTEKERVDLLAYLLRRGANPNLSDKQGFSPLYYAMLSGKYELVEWLLDYDADPDTPLVARTLKHLEEQNSPQAKKITALVKKRLEKLKK